MSTNINWRDAGRTLLIIIFGFFISVYAIGKLSYFFVPHLRDIVLYQAGPRHAPSLLGSEAELVRSRLMLRYLVHPLAGMCVGLFVGLFQKSKPALIAGLCWVPDILDVVLGGDFLRYPLVALRQQAPPELLTVALSMLTGWGVWRLRNRRRLESGETELSDFS